MNYFFKALLLNLCTIGVVLAASAEDMTVIDGYVRGLPPGVPNTSAYMVIQNASDEDLALTGARTDIAKMVMIHETVEQQGQMAMQHLMSVVVPAGGELVLESGGVHLMIMGLSAPVSAGGTVALTLVFSNGLEKDLTLPVRSVLMEK